VIEQTFMEDENEIIPTDSVEPSSPTVETTETEAPSETLDQSFDRVANQIETREAEVPGAVRARGLEKHWPSMHPEVQKHFLDMESFKQG